MGVMNNAGISTTNLTKKKEEKYMAKNMAASFILSVHASRHNLVYYFFSYIPMYGLTVAFKDFNFIGGITGSPWAGLKYFKEFF